MHHCHSSPDLNKLTSQKPARCEGLASNSIVITCKSVFSTAMNIHNGECCVGWSGLHPNHTGVDTTATTMVCRACKPHRSSLWDKTRTDFIYMQHAHTLSYCTKYDTDERERDSMERDSMERDSMERDSMERDSSSSSSRFYYFTRGVPTGVAFLLGTLGEFLPCLHTE